MKFTPIDLQTWPRGQIFYYFSKMAPTGYSMTVPVDVTGLRKTLREAGMKFFPAYLWLVTKNLNRQIEHRRISCKMLPFVPAAGHPRFCPVFVNEKPKKENACQKGKNPS